MRPAAILTPGSAEPLDLAVPLQQRVGEQHELGGAELGVLVDDLARCAARALEQLDVLGHPREAECRDPGLTTPVSSPSPRSSQVDLGEPEPVVVRRECLEPRRAFRPEQQAKRVVLPRPTRPRSWCSWEIP